MYRIVPSMSIIPVRKLLERRKCMFMLVALWVELALVIIAPILAFKYAGYAGDKDDEGGNDE